VNGPDTLSAGSVLWRSSTWTGSGTLTNSASMTADGDSMISSSLVQNGTLLVEGNGSAGHATLTVANGFTNAGTLTLQSANQNQSNLTMTNGTLTNTGTLNVNAGGGGTRTISANLTNSGTVNLNLSATFSKTNGVYTNNNAFTIASAQTLSIAGSSQMFNQDGGTLTINGALSMSSDTFNLDGGTLDLSGSLTLSGATFNFNGGQMTSGTSAVYLKNSALAIGTGSTGAARFRVTGVDATLSGNVAAPQSILVQGNTDVGHAVLTATSDVTNAGAITLESANAPNQSSLAVAAGKVLTNAATGTIAVNTGSGGGRTISADQFTNNGTVTISTDTMFNRAGVTTNTGSFTVAAGQTLTLSGGPSQAFNQNDGTLTVGGAISMIGGTFTFAGGPLDLSGSLTLSGATFNFNGGQMTSGTSAVYLKNSALAIGTGSTGAARFRVTGVDATLSGNVAAPQSILVQGNTDVGHAVLTATSDVTNAGAITLESANAPNQSSLAVAAGKVLTNAATGTIAVNAGSGGGRTLSGTLTNNGTVVVNGTTFSLTGTLTNFSGSTLTGGTYQMVGGTFQFPNTGIVTNAATIMFDGASSRIINSSGSDSLAGFATNTADGSITIQNGRDFTTGGNFTNNGTLGVGAGSTFTVNGSLTNFSGGTLTGGTYQIGGTLKFNNAAITTNAANIVLDGASSAMVDQSSANALANFASNAAAGSFTIQNGRDFTTGGNFSNSGTLVVGGSDTFTVPAAASYSQSRTLNVQSGGTMRVAGTFTNFSGGTLTGGTYQIAGTFQFANAAIATIVLDGAASSITNLSSADALANLASNAAAGSFTIQNGRNLATAGNFANTGNMTVGAGSTFSVSGAYTQSSSLTVQSTGLVNLSGGGSLSGTLGMASGATLNLLGGSFTLSAGTSFTDIGLLQVSGGTLSIPNTMSIPTLELDSGTLTGAGALTITNAFTWTGGTQSGTGSTTLASAATLTLSGTGTRTLDQRTMNLAGTTNWTDGGTLSLASGAALVNQSTGSFTNQDDSNKSITGSGSFTNAGTLNQAGAGTWSVAAGISFSTGGTVNVQGGTLNVAETYTQTSGGVTNVASGSALTSAGGVSIQSGSTLAGSGTINGAVTNAGQLAVGTPGSAGRLTINGTYLQTSTGTLTIKVGGPGAGTGYDQLVVTGAATLGGTLTVTLTGGFMPTSGNTFTVLTYASRTGTFGTVGGDGPLFTVGYNAMDVTLIG
jgi:hypothetical protein